MWAAIAVVVVVIIIIIAVIKMNGSSGVDQSIAASVTHPTQTNAPQVASQSQAQNPSAAITSSSSFDQDLANMDAQMAALNSDSAAADKGLNDQPVSQAQ